MRSTFRLLLLLTAIAPLCCGLDAPNPVSPKGSSPQEQVFEWSAVAGAQDYVIRQWVVDDMACPGKKELSFGGEKNNPYFAIFAATPSLCSDTTCAVQNKAYTGFWNPRTGAQLKYSSHIGVLVSPGSLRVGYINRARACGPGGKTHDGALHIWRWSVQAVSGWDAAKRDWSTKGPESVQTSYWLDEGAPAPVPKPEPLPLKPHPVTFVNQSGKTLYVYSSILPTGSRVICHDFSDNGVMPPGDKKQFVVPPKYTGIFYFQKAPDKCTLSLQYAQKSAPGGNGTSEVITIP